MKWLGFLVIFSCFAQEPLQKAESYIDAKNWDGAYQSLIEVLEKSPCNKEAIKELYKIGILWLNNPDKKKEEVIIFEMVNQCHPRNADTLYYYGRALYQVGKYSQSKTALKECLDLSPTYSDAKILLGYIALQEGDTQKAKAIFQAFPHSPDAQRGLELANQNRAQDRNVHLERAREAHFNLDYDLAETEYAWLMQDQPDVDAYWPAIFDVRSHTTPSVVVTTNYTDAKEDDPDLNAPVVKNYYFLNKVDIRIPICNPWRLDLRQIYYHQRENDIFPPIGVNYSAYSAGGSLISRLFFAKYWRWDLTCRAFRMWGDQSANFPFQNTTRFEPGSTLFYNDGTNLFVVDGHRESYIIKNFTTFRSYLLRTDYLTGVYGWSSSGENRFKAQAIINHIWIHDSLHNWKNSEEVIVSMALPFARFRDYFTILYRFEHGHYDQLNLNYYSFKQQLKNTLGIRFQFDFTPLIFWNCTYEHGWQTTYDLLQPIGTFIFTQQKQYLISNKVLSKFSMQVRGDLRLELEGHYYYQTLPYRDWNLNGSLVWQF